MTWERFFKGLTENLAGCLLFFPAMWLLANHPIVFFALGLGIYLYKKIDK